MEVALKISSLSLTEHTVAVVLRNDLELQISVYLEGILLEDESGSAATTAWQRLAKSSEVQQSVQFKYSRRLACPAAEGEFEFQLVSRKPHASVPARTMIGSRCWSCICLRSATQSSCFP